MIALKDIIIGVSISIFLLLIRFIYVKMYRDRKSKETEDNHSVPILNEISIASPLVKFTYDEIHIATNGFSGGNHLGEGAFGHVHKGVLPDGKLVAVKQLKPASSQGEYEFHTEIQVISQVNHKNLISLIGYCVSNTYKILVYEFVSNETLKIHLHGKDRPTLDWSTRMKIAIGAAKGLTYLHEDCSPCIIHRDIKATNILLEEDFEPKVADFGLAKFLPNSDSHITTGVKGTFGYMDPFYARSGKLSKKSDVFSFGVILLELISGRESIVTTDPLTNVKQSIVTWAVPFLFKALKYGDVHELVDKRLLGTYNHNEMMRMVNIALGCVSEPWRRPRMSQVVGGLEGIVHLENFSELSTSRESYDDLEKFVMVALEARQELDTSVYSGAINEHGQPSAST